MNTATDQRDTVTDTPTPVAVELVDCDVHPEPASLDELREHLSTRWQGVPDHLMSNTGLYMPPAHPSRLDAIGPDGAKAGSDPGFMEHQLLGEAGVDIAILDPLIRRQRDPDFEAALCRATNDWLAENWLSRGHGRFKGSIKVSASDPADAVREIERWAGHPEFVQVLFDLYADAPYGDRRYEPIYEAATRHGLPMAIHFAKTSGFPLATPVGWSPYYFEHHSLFPMCYAAHVVSLICQGTFDRVPGLRFAFLEGGCSWMLPLLWRLENHWDAMHGDLPDATKRRPWEYVREGMRWATQPIEEPRERRHLARAFDLMGAEELLMFSTDYPHWDYDNPTDVMRRLPDAARRRISAGNAIDFYGLPATRAAREFASDV